MIKNIIKRDGTIVEYDAKKIFKAIKGASVEVQTKYAQTDEAIRIPTDSQITLLVDVVEESLSGHESLTVENIQNKVEITLMEMGFLHIAKAYMLYREKRNMVRKKNTTDDAIFELIHNKNKEANTENSNKNPKILSTMRDYIAGETSKDISKRMLLSARVVDYHEKGAIHFHDLDYFIQQGMFNCCLINIEDMLKNGTVMNGKMIEPPKSFHVACNVMTQIIATIASNQYGGQSVNIKHLAPYVDVTRQKIKKQVKEEYEAAFSKEVAEDLINKPEFKEIVEKRVRREVAAGVQTIHYQINTLMTTNGQAPFLTIFMHVEDDNPHKDDLALIVEELLKQRLQGIKNEDGVYITPAFPKLVYVLDENNTFKGGKYDYLTELAAECNAKRMYPDYISAKKMRELHDGQVFSPMGCRSFLSDWKDENGNYKTEGRFNIGVTSVNLPQLAIRAEGDKDKFKEYLDDVLEVVFEAQMYRVKSMLGTQSDVSPLHWQHGAIARLKPGETIDKLITGGYATASLGYIGIYECTKLMTGVSQTTPEGEQFATDLMLYLKDTADKWKEETDVAFGLYGTPAESLCYRFAKIDKERFGVIEDITDKEYYTNSYHVDVREEIDAFSKLLIESKFQNLSTGGAISYIEIPYLYNNLGAIKEVIKYMYDNIMYAEFNTKSDYCSNCSFEGEIKLNEKGKWECPSCEFEMETDGKSTSEGYPNGMLKIVRRVCGYLGENYANPGKTIEWGKRVTHL